MRRRRVRAVAAVILAAAMAVPVATGPATVHAEYAKPSDIQVIRPYITGMETVGTRLTGKYHYYDVDKQHAESGSTFRWLRSDTKNGEYTPIEDMAPRHWTNVDIAVSEAIEFGVKPDCFVAEDAAVFADGEKVADGREETLDYFQTIFRTRVDNDIYCVAYEAHSEEEWKGRNKGEKFVFVRCSDGTTMSVFLGRFNDRKLLSAEVFSGNPKASFTRCDVR